jgi:hypothetical protein
MPQNNSILFKRQYFCVTAGTDPKDNLSDVESGLIAKVNAGETIRFIISEGGDSGVSSWIGLGSDPLLAPQLTMTATGIPEPTSAALSSGLVLVFCFSRRRKTRN